MSEEILVNVTPRETRVAVIENGMLQELHIERGWRRGVVGNIYKGKVQRVMPGMQAAFVEVGLERAAFLHANDIVRSSPDAVVDGEDAALLMVDVDHFRAVNDKHGPACGDAALVEITRIASATLRQYDLLARFKKS